MNIFESIDDPVKILFLISDGESTDVNPTRFGQDSPQSNVTVSSRLLTSENLSQSRRLSNIKQILDGQMFHLSSTIENSHPIISILLELKWKIPSDSHSHIFHIIARVSFDLYMNAANANFQSKTQIDERCNVDAVAMATVLHLAMRRIYRRENDVRQAINHRRPLFVTFSFDENQWKSFNMFYKKKEKQILRK